MQWPIQRAAAEHGRVAAAAIRAADRQGRSPSGKQAEAADAGHRPAAVALGSPARRQTSVPAETAWRFPASVTGRCLVSTLNRVWCKHTSFGVQHCAPAIENGVDHHQVAVSRCKLKGLCSVKGNLSSFTAHKPLVEMAREKYLPRALVKCLRHRCGIARRVADVIFHGIAGIPVRETVGKIKLANLQGRLQPAKEISCGRIKPQQRFAWITNAKAQIVIAPDPDGIHSPEQIHGFGQTPSGQRYRPDKAPGPPRWIQTAATPSAVLQQLRECPKECQFSCSGFLCRRHCGPGFPSTHHTQCSRGKKVPQVFPLQPVGPQTERLRDRCDLESDGSVCQSFCVSLSVSVCQSVCQSVRQSVRQCVCQCVCPDLPVCRNADRLSVVVRSARVLVVCSVRVHCAVLQRGCSAWVHCELLKLREPVWVSSTCSPRSNTGRPASSRVIVNTNSSRWGSRYSMSLDGSVFHHCVTILLSLNHHLPLKLSLASSWPLAAKMILPRASPSIPTAFQLPLNSSGQECAAPGVPRSSQAAATSSVPQQRTATSAFRGRNELSRCAFIERSRCPFAHCPAAACPRLFARLRPRSPGVHPGHSSRPFRAIAIAPVSAVS